MVTTDEFEQLVEEALGELPPRFAELLDNIVVVVEQEPTEDDLEAMDDEAYEKGAELLGLYRGVPMTRRTHDMSLLPDQVAIFRGPILRVAHSRTHIVRQIKETVIHELGHYFGLADHDMVF
ncbi:MAG TPA: metallopeptidase family protein [Thermoanaerobaculia bacterium]